MSMNEDSNNSEDSDDDFITVRVGRRSSSSREEHEAEDDHATKRLRTTTVSRGILQWSQICWDVDKSDVLKLKQSFGVYKCTIKATFEYPKGHMRW